MKEVFIEMSLLMPDEIKSWAINNKVKIRYIQITWGGESETSWVNISKIWFEYQFLFPDLNTEMEFVLKWLDESIRISKHCMI